MRSVSGFGFLPAATVALVIGGSMASCSQSGDPMIDEATVTDETLAAETICPLMWTWVQDIGVIFNGASSEVATIADPQDRRSRWLEAFDEMDTRNTELNEAVDAYGLDPILGPIVTEIQRDIPLATDELNDIRSMIADTPEVDEGRHQNRTSQLLLRIEKVIDLPKPELAQLDTSGSLIAAFGTVPSCQNSVKDVAVGSTQDDG